MANKHMKREIQIKATTKQDATSFIAPIAVRVWSN